MKVDHTLIRRVLILADDTATWRVAGLSQLQRILLNLEEFARTQQGGAPIKACVFWRPNGARSGCDLLADTSGESLEISEWADGIAEVEPFDLVLSTRLFLFRNGVQPFVAAMVAHTRLPVPSAESWAGYHRYFEDVLSTATQHESTPAWRYLRTQQDQAECERAFLRSSGKSQDGLVARYLNRPLSRMLTRWLLRLPITPNTWSALVFSLPLCACLLFLRGTNRMFLLGAIVYQVYSILDGCDGEIARAKFLQTDFGRRLDSFLDLVGNMLLALCLGVGLARHWERGHASGWFYVVEGVAAAVFIALSEGILFVRRSRSANTPAPSGRWNAALYQRHHEFLERSGILLIGDNLAWWMVQLTKRDMAMLAFVGFAAFGVAEAILHLLLFVSGVSAVLAGNAFLRQPAPALAQEAS